jgi:hypothetical protein
MNTEPNTLKELLFTQVTGSDVVLGIRINNEAVTR